MPQEFLASFAVDIDEGGANRLQSILQQNRDLAASVASAFDAARASMQDFIHAASEEADRTFSIDLDFSAASRQLDRFFAEAKKKMKLSADASGIVSAASSALVQVRSMLNSADLSLKVKVETEGGIPSGSGGSSSGSESSSSSGSFFSSLSSAVSSIFSAKPLATGGRFSSPTRAEIAEDGDPEYVVPVKKESVAVPIIRSLLSELSASARESLQTGSLGGSFGNLSGLFSSAAGANAPTVNQTNNNSVQAPVSINVTASGSDPEAVGRSVYDVAEQYLLRTMKGAL